MKLLPLLEAGDGRRRSGVCSRGGLGLVRRTQRNPSRRTVQRRRRRALPAVIARRDSHGCSCAVSRLDFRRRSVSLN